MSDYNENHAASIAYVNDAVAQAYDKMKVWLTTNVDQLDYVQRILEEEISALRVASGTYTSAYEAAEALDNAVADIVSTLESKGVDMTGITTADLAAVISSAIDSQGIVILDVNEDEWTAEEWEAYKEEHGSQPATPAAIGIYSTNGVTYYALTATTSIKWGTYGVNVPNLETYYGGFTGTPKEGLFNTRKLIAQFNPAVLLGSQYAIADGESATRAEAEVADVLFFQTAATLQTWGDSIGAVALAELGTDKMYAVVLDSDAGTYTNYYYSGGGGSVAFTSVRTVPYTDSQSNVGVPAAESAWGYISGLTFTSGNTWVSYLPSVVELGLMYLNATAFQTALAACGGAWYTGNHWSCLQNNNNNACDVEVGAGSVNTYTKSTACTSRACLTKI